MWTIFFLEDISFIKVVLNDFSRFSGFSGFWNNFTKCKTTGIGILVTSYQKVLMWHFVVSPLYPTNFQIFKKWPFPVFCFSKSMVYCGYKINKTKKFFGQIFILWILEVCDVTEVKKDPKTHENWETIEWNSLKKVKIFWILYLDDSSWQKDI